MKDYKIIDNFLNQDHFKKLCELNLEIVDPNNIKVYKNKIDKFNNLNTSCLSNDLLKELHKKNNLKAFCQSLCYLLLIILTGFLSWFSFTYFGNAVGLFAIFLHGTISAFTINAVHELIHGTPFKNKYFNSFFSSFGISLIN